MLTLKQAEADLDVLFRTLQSTYGPYELFGGAAAFDKAKAEILADCKDPKTLTAGVLADSALAHLSFLKDGHFALNNNRTADTVVGYAYSGTAFLKGTDGSITNQKDGRKVASVDEFAALGDLSSLFRLSLSKDGQVVYYLLGMSAFRAPPPPALTVRYADGTSETLSPDPFASGYSEGEKSVELEYRDEIPVLTVRSMGFDEAKDDTIGKEFLAYATALKDAPVLILDLRSNGGGNGILPLKWLEAYTGTPVTTNYPSLMYASEADMKEFCTKTDNQYYNTWQDFDRVAGLKPVSDEYISLNTQPDLFVENDQLLIILTGKNTASAAEGFVDAAHNVANTLVIGQNTYGMLVSNSLTTIYLPNSGTAMQFGGNLCVFPEGYFEEFTGFMPDLWAAGDAEELALKLVKTMAESD